MTTADTTITSHDDAMEDARRFHALRVTQRVNVAADAISFTLAVPPELRPAFRGRPGQHVTLRADIDGTEERRSYSLTSIDQDAIAIAVRHLPDGRVSGHLHRHVAVGDHVEVMPPLGSFVLPDTVHGASLGFVAAGSGIVPIVGMIEAALDADQTTIATLLYVNRSLRTTMFADRLHNLKLRHPERFQVVFVTTRENRSSTLVEQRPDAAALHAIFDAAFPDPDHSYVCGPDDMAATVRSVLDERGVPVPNIHVESFGHTQTRTHTCTGSTAAAVAFTFRGRTSLTEAAAGQRLLDASIAVRPDLPYSCRTGACATCRCRVVRGNVDMGDAVALTDDERAAGFVLACQSTAASDDIELDFDAR